MSGKEQLPRKEQFSGNFKLNDSTPGEELFKSSSTRVKRLCWKYGALSKDAEKICLGTVAKLVKAIQDQPYNYLKIRLPQIQDDL